MKRIFSVEGTLADKITYYHLLVFAIALPFDRLYSELALISLSVHTLMHVRKKDLQTNTLIRLLIPVSIYVLTIAGTAYTRFYNEAFFEWERQLAILLFPLIILFNSFSFHKHYLRVLLGMGVSCAIAIIYLYYEAFSIIRYNHLSLASIFSAPFINHNFSAPIEIHATYFSAYIALAATAVICFLFSGVSKNKWIYIVVLIVLMAGLVQLASRAVIIAFGIIVNVVIPVFLFHKRKRMAFIAGSVTVSLVMVLVFTQVGSLRTRFILDLKEDLTETGINNTLEPRIARWECAWQLISSSPVYGYGSGSEVFLLRDIYFEKKLYNSYINELNAHNQYLSMLIKTGVIGLLVLLFVFYTGFRQAISLRNVPFCAFMVITTVLSFSENILDVNKGIFFFAFFYSLFYLGLTEEEPITQK